MNNYNAPLTHNYNTPLTDRQKVEVEKADEVFWIKEGVEQVEKILREAPGVMVETKKEIAAIEIEISDLQEQISYKEAEYKMSIAESPKKTYPNAEARSAALTLMLGESVEHQEWKGDLEALKGEAEALKFELEMDQNEFKAAKIRADLLKVRADLVSLY